MREVIDTLLASAVEIKDEDGNQKLELAEELDVMRFQVLAPGELFSGYDLRETEHPLSKCAFKFLRQWIGCC